LALLLVTIVATASPSTAGAEGVAGPAFSPPVVDTTLMAPGWAGRPVRHGPRHAAADLVVTLDQQIYPAVASALAHFAAERGVRIDVERGTCGVSAGAVARREVEIAGFCCPPGPDDRLPGVRYRTLGIAAIALIVHPENPVRDLSLRDARALFSGHLRQWSEVKGGAGFARRVTPVVRLHCKRRPGHWRLLLDNEDLFSPRAIEVGAIEDMVEQVARRPGAVGWETAWMADHRADEHPVRTVRLDGVDPVDTAALATGRYPLYRTFTLATWATAEESPLVAAAVAEIERTFAAEAGTFVTVPTSILAQHGWHLVDGELQGEPGR